MPKMQQPDEIPKPEYDTYWQKEKMRLLRKNI